MTSRAWRLHHTLEALHTVRLDGLAMSTAALRDALDYVDGRRTLDEILEDVIRRHTADNG